MNKRNMIYCRYIEVLRIYSPLIIAKFYTMQVGRVIDVYTNQVHDWSFSIRRPRYMDPDGPEWTCNATGNDFRWESSDSLPHCSEEIRARKQLRFLVPIMRLRLGRDRVTHRFPLWSGNTLRWRLRPLNRPGSVVESCTLKWIDRVDLLREYHWLCPMLLLRFGSVFSTRLLPLPTWLRGRAMRSRLWTALIFELHGPAVRQPPRDNKHRIDQLTAAKTSARRFSPVSLSMQ